MPSMTNVAKKIKKYKIKIKACEETIKTIQNVDVKIFYKLTDKIYIHKRPNVITKIIEEKVKVYKRDKFELEKQMYARKKI